MNHIGPRLMYVHTLVLHIDEYICVNNTEAVCERSDFRGKRLGFVRLGVPSNETRFCNNTVHIYIYKRRVRKAGVT